MSKPIVYLAGPIHGLTYSQAVTWRDRLTASLRDSFDVLSPMRDKERLMRRGPLVGEYRDTLLSRAEAIVMRDLTDVARADLLIVNGLQGTFGTAVEVGYAVALIKPIIAIEPAESPIRVHPFARALPKLMLVEDFEEASLVAHSLFNV